MLNQEWREARIKGGNFTCVYTLSFARSLDSALRNRSHARYRRDAVCREYGFPVLSNASETVGNARNAVRVAAMSGANAYVCFKKIFRSSLYVIVEGWCNLVAEY